MSVKEKLLKKLRSKPKDFTFDEGVTLLRNCSFELSNRGKTSGSAVEFRRGEEKFKLHRPHPGNELKGYVVERIARLLEKEEF